MLQAFKVIQAQSDALGKLIEESYEIRTGMEKEWSKETAKSTHGGSSCSYPAYAPTVSVRDAINVHDCDPTNIN